MIEKNRHVTDLQSQMIEKNRHVTDLQSQMIEKINIKVIFFSIICD
jgi:hypothetical protein